MEITCPRCQSLHEIEPPASARARGPRSLKFRCSHCGHTFTVDPSPHADEPAAPPPLAEGGGGAEPVSLLQLGGEVWSVPDMAALQRWILERRLDRDAMVSRHGMRWARAGDRPDLEVFFAAADALSFRDRNLRTEMPAAMDEDIVVDAGEADDSAGGVPVTFGPGPSGAFDASVLEFTEVREDTVEQTMRSMGVDEAPIPEVPAGFARLAPPEEPTTRFPPPTAGFPSGVATVTPRDAPLGSAAAPTWSPPRVAEPARAPRPVEPSPAPAPPTDAARAPEARAAEPRPAERPAPAVALPGAPVVGPPVVNRSAPRPAPGPVSPAASAPPAPPAPPAPGPAPSTLVPPGASASQSFFFEPSPASPAPARQRDVFDDPPTRPPSSAGPWPWIALLFAGFAAVAVIALWPKPPAETAPSAAPAAPQGAASAPSVPAATAAADAPPPAPEAATAEKPAVARAENPVVEKAAAAKPTSAEKPTAPAEKPAAPAEKPVEKVARAPAEKPPAAAKPAGGSAKALVGQGWKAVEAGDFPKAHGLFDRALQSGGSADALYGRGYANEKLGDAVSAADDYCRALATGGLSVDTQRELEGALRRVGRACN